MSDLNESSVQTEAVKQSDVQTLNPEPKPGKQKKKFKMKIPNVFVILFAIIIIIVILTWIIPSSVIFGSIIVSESDYSSLTDWMNTVQVSQLDGGGIVIAGPMSFYDFLYGEGSLLNLDNLDNLDNLIFLLSDPTQMYISAFYAAAGGSLTVDLANGTQLVFRDIPATTSSMWDWYDADTMAKTNMVFFALSVDNGFNNITEEGAGIMDIFWAPFAGFEDAIEIIIFIFILGGFIQIMLDTKTLEAGINSLLNRSKGREIIIFPILFVLFSLGGSVYGMQEETIGLFLIITPIVVLAGFDAMSGVLVIVLGTMTGVMASTLNPFTVSVAVDSANVEDLLSSTGLGIRFGFWFVATVAGAILMTWYANRIKKHPEKSPEYNKHDEHIEWAKKYVELNDSKKMTKRQMYGLIIFGLTFALMILLFIPWGEFFSNLCYSNYGMNGIPYFATFFAPIGSWYLLDIAGLFFISTIVMAFIFKLSTNQYISAISRGAADMIGVAFIIAFARAPQILMQGTGIDITIVGTLSGWFDGTGNAFPLLMLFAFMILAFAIPSTSGLAGVTMPVVGPIAYNIGGTNLAAATVTSYSAASGITQMWAPTNGILMAGAEMSQVEYVKTLRLTLPYAAIMTVISMIFIIIESFAMS